MIESLIALLFVILVVGIVYWFVNILVNMLEEPFRKIAHVVLILICVLVILAKALPLIGINIG